MIDLAVEYDDIRDELVLEPGGATRAFKRVAFRIGRFGPFVERVENTPAWSTELQARIAALKSTLGSLPR